CIHLGDMVVGTHLSTVAGTIHGIMEDMEVTMVVDTDMDMEVVFMMDTILDSPITDQVEVLEFTDHQQVDDQVWLALQDAQVELLAVVQIDQAQAQELPLLMIEQQVQPEARQ